MSEQFRLDRKIGFQNMFYTKCINVIIGSTGPSIILRSICSNNDRWTKLVPSRGSHDLHRTIGVLTKVTINRALAYLTHVWSKYMYMAIVQKMSLVRGLRFAA